MASLDFGGMTRQSLEFGEHPMECSEKTLNLLQKCKLKRCRPSRVGITSKKDQEEIHDGKFLYTAHWPGVGFDRSEHHRQ
jgi:hypothetical protein